MRNDAEQFCKPGAGSLPAAGPKGAPRAQGVAGDSVGTLSAGGSQLRLIVDITKSAGGGLAGTLDSQDQGAMVDALHGAYDGKLSAAGDAIHGTWNQASRRNSA
ncbi:MAG: hypothetical protein ACLQU1_18075 [Bryobacteraceae bacterium]